MSISSTTGTVIPMSRKAAQRSKERNLKPLNEYNPPAMVRGFPKHMVEFFAMLTYCRPHGSSFEGLFTRKWVDTLPGIQADEYGNRYVCVGDYTRVAFTSHLDTVHVREGIQAIQLGERNVRLFPASKANCLGADDTSGVWLMREMILAGKPGLYLFFRGEEVGCLGSSHFLKHTQLPTDLEIMISLDRRGKNDVITHQCGSRTSSNAFALSLADQLALGYLPDDGGVFTDSNEFRYDIAECTNISVGYDHQHSTSEIQDFAFLQTLRDKLLALDCDKLTVEREPGACEDDWRKDYDKWADKYGAWVSEYGGRTVTRSSTATDEERSYARLLRMVKDYPEVITDLLQQYGIGFDDVSDHIETMYPGEQTSVYGG